MKPEEIIDLHNLCKIIGLIKKQMIDELPHYGNEALYFNNDEITTGLLDNKIEIKINLLANKLQYFNNEKGFSVDLNNDGVLQRLKQITDDHDLKFPEITVGIVDNKQSFLFLNYAVDAARILELFRVGLQGRFTLVHLWPDHFDFSVEWFTQKNDEQIGTGISPGDEQYPEPYLYMNPWKFNDQITKEPLPIGKWHTSGWNGIKVEWMDMLKFPPKEAAEKINELFEIAKKNFELS